MYSFILLREHSRTARKLLLPSNLTFLRSVAGGAGAFNKWKWKRMHEKKAREKERQLLDQEKLVRQSRDRSQIRTQLAGKSDHTAESDRNYTHMTTDQHVKALADRFMKPGAEDLWNEADGPVTSAPPTPKNPEIRPPIDVKKVISRGDRTLKSQKLNLSMNCRHYSSSVYNRGGGTRRGSGSGFKFRRNDSSDSDDGDYGFVSDGDSRPMRWRSGVEEKRVRKDSMSKIMAEEKPVRRDSMKKVMRSRAALGEFDTAKPRRVLFEDLREEIMKKNSVINDEGRSQWSSAEDMGSVLSEKRFDEYDVSSLTIKALNEAGYVQTTRAQEATFSVCIDGVDALVKAKTGTGKSVAFLLLAIETVLKASSEKARLRVPPIFVLILCPTRELASQVAAEAKVLLRYHNGIGVQTLIGGTRFKDDQKRLDSEPSQIIVATPGRLLDHIENKSGVSTRLMGLKLIVLDEADHMVDLGFRKDIEKIFDCLPRQKQSIMFSAAVPKQVRRLSQLVLKREHKYIDTTGVGCVETPEQVKQCSLVAPHEQHFQIVYHLLNEHASKTHDYKVIVFCSTEMVTSLFFLLMREMKLNVRELHSRKTPMHRTRVSEEFKESKRMILITSDVPSREMNYPDVSLVIQVGVPSDREQYIHRVGSTGQEGKEGEGILLLAPWEAYFLEELRDLPIEKVPSPQLDPGLKMKMKNSMSKIDGSIKEGAYHAWLSHYNSITEIGRDKTTLAELSNQFSQSLGFEKPPQLFKKTAMKMGLDRIHGIRIRK